MNLTLIAEILSGETMITPGGAVDAETACCREAFTWDSWLHQVLQDEAAELTGTAVVAEALAE